MTKCLLVLLLGVGVGFAEQKAPVEVECNCLLVHTQVPGFCDFFTTAVRADWPKGGEGWRISFKTPPEKKRRVNEFVMVLTHKGELGTSTYNLNFRIPRETNGVEFSETMAKEAITAVTEYTESVRVVKSIFTPSTKKKQE